MLLLADWEFCASQLVIDSLDDNFGCLVELFLHQLLFFFISYHLQHIKLLALLFKTSLCESTHDYVGLIANVSVLFDSCLNDGLPDFVLHFCFHFIQHFYWIVVNLDIPGYFWSCHLRLSGGFVLLTYECFQVEQPETEQRVVNECF